MSPLLIDCGDRATVARAIKVGDTVRTHDRAYIGTVLEVRSYTGMSDKLIVRLNPPHYGQSLLAVELWERCSS